MISLRTRLCVAVLVLGGAACGAPPGNEPPMEEKGGAPPSAGIPIVPVASPTGGTSGTPPSAREMVLNPYIAKASASAAYEKKHPAAHAFDGDCATAWNAKVQAEGTSWLEIEFDIPRRISSIHLTPGWELINKKGEDLFSMNYQARKVTVRFDDAREVSKEASLEERLLVFGGLNETARKVRFRFDTLWPTTKYRDIAVSDIVLLGPVLPGEPSVPDAFPRCDRMVQARIEAANPLPFASETAVCNRLQARADSLLNPLRKAMAESKNPNSDLYRGAKAVIEHHGHCFAAGKGSWMLLPYNLSFEQRIAYNDDDYFIFAGKHLVAYVSETGAVSVWSKPFNIVSDMFDHSFDAVKELTITDFNNDGVRELIMDRSCAEEGGLFTVWTVENGQVVPYAGVKDIGIRALVDYDKDGRVDLVTYGPWRTELLWGNDEYDISLGAPTVLYHNRADGTLSAADEVAKAYLKEQCSVATGPLLQAPEQGWENVSFLRISCERLRGKSADEVIARLKNEWGTFNPSEDISAGLKLDAFEKWAKKDPLCTL